jgi:hypothetical protein
MNCGPRTFCFAASFTVVLCAALAAAPNAEPELQAANAKATSDEKAIRAADYSLLFVGNSHTAMHDLPQLIRRMIEDRHPAKKVATQYVGAGFLEDAYQNPACIDEIKSRPWKHVILQAQKISMSGKYNYSRMEGIELAKLAKEKGTAAIYYPEWGLKGVAGDGERQLKVYVEMAKESGAGVAPVSRAWDLALEKQPKLELHNGDGNHQSAIGAFLTACVLYGQITGESPLALAEFPYPSAGKATRKFLATCADSALNEQKEKTRDADKKAAAKSP